MLKIAWALWSSPSRGFISKIDLSQCPGKSLGPAELTKQPADYPSTFDFENCGFCLER